MGKIYINWSDRTVRNAKQIEKEIDQKTKEFATESNFRDFLDENYTASDIFDMISASGLQDAETVLREDWAKDIRNDATDEVLIQYSPFEMVDDDWD